MKLERLKVSIVLPTYNGERFIKESVESIIGQTYSDWELIIVNDCSTDGTAEIIEGYASEDARIQIINNPRNMKLPKSLNIGFERAKGEFFTWTSDDNYFEETAIEKMVSYLEKHEEAPMVVAAMDIVDAEGNVVGEKKCKQRNYMAYGNNVGACFLYRAKTAKIIGQYDESKFLVEDYDYWIRIQLNCGEIHFLEEHLYKYRVHGDSLTTIRRKEIKEALLNLRTAYFPELVKMAANDEELLFMMYCEMIELHQLPEDREKLFEESSEVIRSLSNYNSNSPAVIYGAGKYGRALLRYVNDVMYYVDRNPDLIGKEVEGKKVISLQQYKSSAKKYQLIVAMNYSNMYSVLKDLIANGVDCFCIAQDIISRHMDYDEFEALL